MKLKSAKLRGTSRVLTLPRLVASAARNTMNDDMEMGDMFLFEDDGDDVKEPQTKKKKEAKQPSSAKPSGNAALPTAGAAKKKKKEKPQKQPEPEPEDDAAVAAPEIYVMDDDDDDDGDGGDDGGDGAELAGAAPADAAGTKKKKKKQKKKRKFEDLADCAWAGGDWAKWLAPLADGVDTGALERRVYAPAAGEGAGDVIANCVRRASKGRDRAAPPRGLDVVLVCASAKRAADVAKTLRKQRQVPEVLKLFGKHLKAADQAAQLEDAAKPLPRVAVATPARLEVLLDSVPWGRNATLLVDTRPDGKNYTPFTLPDAKAALARVVAALLGSTDLAFCAADAGP